MSFKELILLAIISSLLVVMFFYLIDFIFCKETKKYIGSKKWKEEITKKVNKLETEQLTNEWEQFLKEDSGSDYQNETIKW